MQISVIKPGLLSTIQDLGRNGYLSQAVPVSGAMDSLSARLANMALGNNEGAAVVEFTLAGAEFRVDSDILMAWCGDGAIFMAGSTILPADRPVFIPAGTVIRIADTPTGCRSYLAVAGGWDVPEVLGSRSTYLTAGFGGLQGRALQKGDALQSAQHLNPVSKSILNSLRGAGIRYPSWKLSREQLAGDNKKMIRVVPAHEFGWFSGSSLVDFLSVPFTISKRSNRMGYHLEGKTIERVVQDELLSTAVTPGTIQVTGQGSMVLLMADCQTTGGYPRIAQVAAVDLALCGQLKPGDTTTFTEISRTEAEELYLDREQQLSKLRAAVEVRSPQTH